MADLICAFHTSVPKVASVGHKAAVLTKLLHAGFPVPPGFCLTVAAYRSFLRDCGLDRVAATAHTSSHAASELRAAIMENPLPLDLKDALIEAWQQWLGGQACVVRSSAVDEDTPEATFAGQFETVLNVRDEETLERAVRRCWASLWNDRAIAYRQARGIKRVSGMAVIVQAMVDAEAAGVLYTVDPRDPELLLVEATWGLGQAVVEGMVTVDRWRVHRGTGQVLEEEIAEKERLVTPLPGGGVETVPVPESRRTAPTLTSEQLTSLAELALRVEAALDYAAQDIEWAWQDGQFFILQARPIVPAPSFPTVWSGTNPQEVVPGVMCPLAQSLIEWHMDVAMPAFMRAIGSQAEVPAAGVIRFFGGRAYMNMSYVIPAYAGLPGRDRMEAALNVGFDPRYLTLLGPASEEQRAPWWAGIRMLAGMGWLIRRTPTEIRNVEALVRPRVADLEATWDELDVAQQAQALEEIAQLGEKVVTLHVRASSLSGGLLEPLAKIFGEGGTELMARALGGLEGMSTAEIGLAIRQLACLAAEDKDVRAVLYSDDPVEALAQLRQLRPNAPFVQAWDAFLSRFGHRAFRELDIAEPRWEENPRFVVELIRRHLNQGDLESPEQLMEAQYRRRHEAYEEIYARLRRAGRGFLVPLVRYLLSQAAFYTVARENMKDLWTYVYAAIRRLALRVGKQWVHASWLDKAEETFYLRFSELVDGIQGRLKPDELRRLIAHREAEMRSVQSAVLPEPLVGHWGPENRRVSLSAAEGVAKDRVLVGVGASPGRVTGVARILHDPVSEAGHLGAGEILVTVQTDPAWTALFVGAGGVVTELGGMISHAAIVAREFGIPAVLAVRGATRHIIDGQRITVDGGRGVVYLEEALDDHSTR